MLSWLNLRWFLVIGVAPSCVCVCHLISVLVCCVCVSQTGLTPLMEAASGGYHEVGRILVEHVSGERVLVSWALGGGHLLGRERVLVSWALGGGHLLGRGCLSVGPWEEATCWGEGACQLGLGRRPPVGEGEGACQLGLGRRPPVGERVLVSWALGGGHLLGRGCLSVGPWEEATCWGEGACQLGLGRRPPVGEGEGAGQPCVDVPETPSPHPSHRVLT